MVKRPAGWFRNVAVGGIAGSLLMVWAMEALQEAHLLLWLHIPLTMLVLTGMAAGAGLAGLSWVEYRARLTYTPTEAQANKV